MKTLTVPSRIEDRLKKVVRDAFDATNPKNDIEEYALCHLLVTYIEYEHAFESMRRKCEKMKRK